MNHVSATLIFSFIKTEFVFLPKCLIAANVWMCLYVLEHKSCDYC